MCSHKTKETVKAVAQGLINDVDQDVVYYAKLALALRWMCCVQHDLRQIPDKWEARKRRLSCYLTWRRMISTSSYGRYICGLMMYVFHSTTTAMCTMCCAGKGHSVCVGEVHGLGAGTVELRV